MIRRGASPTASRGGGASASDAAGGAQSCLGHRIRVDVLARLVSVHGAPRYLRSDNGPEFVSKAKSEELAATGFDANYEPTSLGRLLEVLIDYLNRLEFGPKPS